MNTLEDMKSIWQAIGAELPAPEGDRPLIPGKLTSKLRMMEQEEGRGSYLAGAVFMSVLGTAILGLGIQKEQLFGMVAGVLVIGLSLLFWQYARRWKALREHRPETNLIEYLSGRRRQLALLIRLRWLRIIPALAVGGFFLSMNQGDILPDDPVQLVGIIGFVIVALLLAGVLVWWYQTQHPWKARPLLREIDALLADWKEEG